LIEIASSEMPRKPSIFRASPQRIPQHPFDHLQAGPALRRTVSGAGQFLAVEADILLRRRHAGVAGEQAGGRGTGDAVDVSDVGRAEVVVAVRLLHPGCLCRPVPKPSYGLHWRPDRAAGLQIDSFCQTRGVSGRACVATVSGQDFNASMSHSAID
jgi:hypothetical protein